ncbi:hypothetical protein AWM68_06715 [Fictibacillus phosphorivorans]|uniref:DUF2515 domain-containing protein n=1 Tax=Fictibacillus phosphorivorans TaxID=1221500 RepID=A0A161RW65_9BACL|nr:DUF2515 family protein [Fictibacillus phosphorivorans]KZE66062.1 hypothetical protein AWM68_06715 [Fictibacillus phosphorivorans]
MNASKRLLTKFTLIPFQFLLQPFSVWSRKKVLWELSSKQKIQLQILWNKINKKQKNHVRISFRNHRELIENIKYETRSKNKDNITRTTAYLSFFKKHPEIQWSFLAHMVSRNAGYFMTDLKGEFLPHIIEDVFGENLYSMLEKGNSMIFEDAYPQLLLYEESKKKGTSLFYLCQFFNVSPFMEGVWELYVQGDHSPLLPIAQIINEQSHIEKHLVQTPEYQRLLKKLTYRIQEWLQLSQILFPVLPLKNSVGKNMYNFESLNARIELGQNLYHILFHPKHFQNTYSFALQIPHTGSRSDYDRSVFTLKDDPHKKKYPIEKLSFFKTKRNQKIYSPHLYEVWKQNYHGPFFKSNWFSDQDFTIEKIRWVKKKSVPISISYWAGLHKLESAFLLKHYYRLIKKNRGHI